MNRALLISSLLLLSWSTAAHAAPGDSSSSDPVASEDKAGPRDGFTLQCFGPSSMSMSMTSHTNNFPFDYDPNLSEDPAGIPGDLANLHSQLPGLPDGLVEIEMDGIKFNYFAEVLDMVQRARDSGPQIAPPIQRPAVRCAVHDAFAMPAVLIQPVSSSCQSAAQQIASALAGSAKTCQQVEYPEVYVLDHPSAVVDANFLGQSQLLSTTEGQIALIGEALSHLDYPVGLIPDTFMPMARSIVAKIRYQKLRDNIDARLALYSQAKATLQNSASCFNPGPSATLAGSLDGLTTELTAVGQHLDQVKADGLAQAAADRLAVENQGRLRNDLMHPSLTDREREMLAFYLAAVYWRMRGGGLIRNPANGTVPDITYVTNIFAGIAKFAGGIADADTLGYNMAIDESHGYQEWWDLGNEPGHDQYYDLLWMTDRGRRGLALTNAMLGDLGYDVKNLMAGGLIMGPCYYYMWYELWARNGRFFQLGENLTSPYYLFLEMPVATGESCYGAAMGLGLARSLLWGVPNPSCHPEPDCGDAVCGSDGCGGSCGTCSSGSCEEGQCVDCVADCTGRECGDDGCGNSCGQCADDESCNAGMCEPGTGGECTGDNCVDDCVGDDCPTPPSPGGGSCQSAPGAGHLLPLLLILLLFGRRRRA